MSSGKGRIFYGWFAVIGAFLAMGASAGTSIYVFSIFVTPVVNDLSIPVSAFMVNMTILMFAAMVFAPVTGRLVEKKGLRYTTILGGAVMTLGHVILGLAKSLPMIYIGYVIVGIAAGIAGPVISTTVAANWFVKKRGIATGIITAGNGIFGLVLAPVMARFITDYGYSFSYFILAAVDFVFIILCGGLLIRNSPQEMGLYPDGDDSLGIREGQSTGETIGLSLPQAMKTKAFWIVGIGFGFLSFVQFGTAQTHNPALQSVGVSTMAAAAVVSVVGIVSAVIKLVYGILIDRYSVKLVTALGMAATIAACLMIYNLTGRSPVLVLYLYAVVFGCAYGMWLPVMTKHLTDSFGIKHYASVFSVLFMMKNIADTMGPMVPSAFFDLSGSYKPAYLLFAGIAVILSIVLLTYKKPKAMIEQEDKSAADRAAQ